MALFYWFLDHWAVLRTIYAVIAGILVGCLVVGIIESAGMYYFFTPFPDVDMSDPAQVRLLMEQGKIPLTAVLSVLVAWVSGAFCGSWYAARQAMVRKLFCGWLVGSFFMFCCLLMLFEIPHPLGFSISAILLVPLASWFGASWGAQQGPTSEMKSSPPPK